jgi:hypothetical protein
MDKFVPFGISKTAQDIITEHLNTPKTPSTDVFRNPNFDLRTEQGLPSDALYPNPLLDTTPPTDAPVDPCPPGYMLVDGICQPIEQFGQSAYDEQRDDNPDAPPIEYYSIDDMKKMDDYEFLNYLTGAGAYMTGKDGQYTLNDPAHFGLFTMGLDKLFGNSRQLRNDFMKKKLNELGYSFTNNKDGEPVYNLQNPMEIINNAQLSNQGGNRSRLATNQLSIFTPEEINYQIDAKNERDRTNDQQNYAREMTRQQIKDDADKSGGTRNPFEMNQVNNSSPSNVGYKPAQRRNPNMNNR